MQTNLGLHACVLYLQLYVDATHLTIIGNVKVWPVYAWLGNLPASVRKKRGKGGAVLVAYLPFVSFRSYKSLVDTYL